MEIAVIDLPHISNFTDFDAFRSESDVRLRIVRSAADLNRPDAVIIPGSKNTLGDLEYLRRSGLAERIDRPGPGRHDAKSSASAADCRCSAAKSAIRWASNRRRRIPAGWDCSPSTR